MPTLFTTTRQWVEENYGSKKMPHVDRTVYWVEQFKPGADEAFRIAAIAHDMERAFRGETYAKIQDSPKEFTDEEHLKYRQEEGARLGGEFLSQHGAPSNLIERVKELISKHEIGGTEDQNILKDADSMSYFETQIDGFIKDKVPQVGKEKVKEKFEWMFTRITSEKAQEIARPLYEQAIQKLDAI